MTPHLRWRVLPWAGAALLLLVPALAMRVTDEVAWGPEDFLALGLLLALGCGAWEIATRRPSRRAVAALVILGAVLYVWAELAVGVLTGLGS
ncbi:hypothetical protein [Rubellimicrobium arenae]|uniref:hypothetical protein n=1 Tax=Rubellimicrobium arenae TaxID=2817372 RepID=UPI001B3149C8|nr:hypothetical protein [Rubellimicrobium arenae]